MDASEKDSIVWSALGYLAGKRTNRDALESGSSTKLALDITGLINGRAKFASTISGTLNVGTDSESASSSAPDANVLITHILDQLPDDAARAKIMQKVVELFERTGELPVVKESSNKATIAWLKRLRSTKQATKRGSVAFALLTE